MSITKSVLNKRHNDIFYHRVWEAQYEGILSVGQIPREFNLEYYFTKKTIPVNKRHHLVESILLITATPIGGIERV